MPLSGGRTSRFRRRLFALIVACLIAGPFAFGSPARAEAPTLDVLFVLDNSGSMRKNDPDFLTRNAVSDFVTALRNHHTFDGRVGLVLFDAGAELVLPLTKVDAPEAEAELAFALARLDFGGQLTHSPAGVERALYELGENGKPGSARAIILLTDGKIETGDRPGDLEAARWLREDLAAQSAAEGIRIFGIAFTEGADYPLMQALALRTQARYYRAFKAENLQVVIADVLERVSELPARPLPNSIHSEATPSETETFPAPPRSESPEALAHPGASPPDGQLPAALESPSAFARREIILPLLVVIAGLLALFFFRRVPSKLDPAPAADRFAGEAPPAALLDFGGQIAESGTALALRRDRTTIGRDPHNDIVLEDDTISSEHAVIEFRDGRYWLEDARSTNGTRHGDRRLGSDRRVPLKGGDHIRFAEIDLMFVLAGYVPGGATVYLSSATHPPEERSPTDAGSPPLTPAQPTDASPPERVSQPIAESVAEPLPEPNGVRDLDSQLALDDRTPPDDIATEVHPPPSDESAETERRASAHFDAEVYEACLHEYLERVRSLSPGFSDFVEMAFEADLRAALAVSATERIEAARRDGGIAEKDYTADHIRYLILGMPVPIEAAQARFAEVYGGFTRLISAQLASESFDRDQCEVLTVLTFGAGATPWVSLSIVPTEAREPQIDLLSYEFLSDHERREIEPTLHPEISQVGLR